MTSAQVVETSVNVISNSPSQDYTHPDDRTSLNYEMPLICRLGASKDKKKLNRCIFMVFSQAPAFPLLLNLLDEAVNLLCVTLLETSSKKN